MDAQCLCFAFVCGLILSCAPSVVTQRKVDLPAAYALRAKHPLADTSQLSEPAHEGERLHGAKLTSRITGSILPGISNQFSLHPYLPASLGIVVAGRISGDRLSGPLMGPLFAGFYASSTSFSISWMPKPFDGVAIGPIAMSAAFRDKPW